MRHKDIDQELKIINMKNNDEKALEIAKQIKDHRIGEEKIYATNKAIGISNVNYFNEDRTLWLVNSENTRGIKIEHDFLGNPIINKGEKTTYEDDGRPIFKNTRIGEVLIRNSKGKHTIKTPKGNKTLKVYNNAFYTPATLSHYAKDIKLNLNESKSRYYNNLLEIIERVDELDKKIIEAKKLKKEQDELIQQEQKDTKRRDELLKEIEKASREKEEELNKMQSFIRKSAELRYQPILDPWQEEIKRSLLYNGTLAIDGGPGTGKTTSLIQRIKFLTDYIAIEEYLPNLTKSQKEKITSANNWIFFSPSDLLKQFLKNSMTQEGLLANDETVKVWSNYKSILLKKYKLINSDTQNPFLVLRRKSDIEFLPSNSKSLKKLIISFENFFIEHQTKKLQKLISADVTQFDWKITGASIQNYIKRQDKANNLDNLIKLYFNIQDEFNNDVKKIATYFFKILKESAANIIVKLEKETKIIDDIRALFIRWEEETNIEDISDSTEIEDNLVEDSDVVDEGNFNSKLLSKIKSLIRKLSIQKYDKNQRLSARDKELNKIIITVIKIDSLSDYDKLGQYAYFIKYFEKSTKGIVSNLFSEIPMLYKSFRKKSLKEKKLPFNNVLLKQIVEEEKDKNKRIHPEEQAFLIYFINNLIRKTYKVSKLKANKINHNYFEGFRELSKPVIGVDEATDFHIIDLLCIHSLSDIEISSITYSGDLMQRLTKNGLKNWNDLKSFISNTVVKELVISYRQSPTLLEIAQELYKTATSEDAEYISYMNKDENEPKPLLFVNNSIHETLEWISERIIEIYKAYGNSIPSIAIFLPNDEGLDNFANSLGEIDRLADVDIKVKAYKNGIGLGDTNTVRVFSIEYIKGLEFEAVFFHNIDYLLKNKNLDLMFKNLYVGLSRASFYLGLTSKIELEEITSLPNILIDKNENWKVT